MNDPDSDRSLLLPLLFAKPGLATLPVMRLSLVRSGGAPRIRACAGRWRCSTRPFCPGT